MCWIKKVGMMRHDLKKSLVLLCALTIMSGCTQKIPSIMNNSKPVLANETIVEQIPLAYVNEATLRDLATMHRQSGAKEMDITMAYDPQSKDFTAMKAVHKLKEARSILHTNGVQNIEAQTLAVPDGTPMLIVSYNTVTAQAPLDCPMIPGIEDRRTDRDLGAYRLGCATETMISKQIARPSDLAGNSELGPRDGRRDSIMLNDYMGGVPRERLQGVERDNL